MSSTRVMATCATMGQAVGTAAALAVRHNTDPRGIWENHIEELRDTLMEQDQYIPFTTRKVSPLSLAAKVSHEALRNGHDRSFGETDNGTFYIYLKYAVQDMRGYNEDGSKYLSPGVKWVGYFNGGEGFHTADWNYYGIQVGDPAHYGSHGCVNMYEADAKWIYDNCPEGTIVQVVGSTPSGPVR